MRAPVWIINHSISLTVTSLTTRQYPAPGFRKVNNFGDGRPPFFFTDQVPTAFDLGHRHILLPYVCPGKFTIYFFLVKNAEMRMLTRNTDPTPSRRGLIRVLLCSRPRNS